MTPELTQEQINIAASSAADAERPSPGALVRRARERARVTPEELAAQTKLSRVTLDALERDDFNTLSEPVFVRGYYRKCAKVLAINEQDLLDAYQARVAPRNPMAPSKLRLASGTELGSGSRLPVPFAVVAAIVAVIVCAFIWFARGEPNPVPRAVSAKADAMTPESAQHIAEPSQPVLQTLPLEPAASAVAADRVPGQMSGETLVQTPPASSMVPSTPALVPTTSAAPKATTVTPAAPAMKPSKPLAAKPLVPTMAPSAASAAALKTAGGAVVTLNFTVTSWARVDDANGKTLLNGLMRAGDKQNLSGAAPFTVFLGNAPGVRAEINGTSVDLAKYTAANNTARFTLGTSKP